MEQNQNDKVFLVAYNDKFVEEVNQKCLEMIHEPFFSISDPNKEPKRYIDDLQGEIMPPMLPLDLGYTPFYWSSAPKERKLKIMEYFPFLFECKFKIKERHIIERSRNSKTQQIIKSKTVDWYFEMVVDKKFDRQDIGQAIYSISRCGFEHGSRIYVGDKILVAFRPKPYLSWTKILESISRYLICYIPKDNLDKVKKHGLNYPANAYNTKKLICHLPLSDSNILQTELKPKKKRNYVAVGINIQKVLNANFYFGKKENEYYTMDWISPTYLEFFD